ncbi:MAG: biotin/lipoyl-binding protein [Rhizobiaceae bacterium]
MDGLLKQEEKESAPLPVLRDDLEIVPTAAQSNGAPAWVIFDPVSNRYFEIGRELLDMLMLWRLGTVEQLIRRVRAEFGRVINEDEVGDAIHFLISNALVRDIPGNDYKTMAAKEAAGKKSWLERGMHSYLFFRIPLFRPDRFLRATWPYVAPLFTRTAVWIYVLLGCIGLYLVSRQWDQFTGTFQFMLSWQGAAFYGISLVFVKSLHELGHAYMSVRYGLRVPTIGIAFMVLMPVLYTDTSGAWRLRSRRKRLMIDGAGIFTELSLAAIATLLWVFLPDGGFRLCVFAIATTSWVTSLAVNLNPLMRFDGYYILSDTLGFQNMQSRGFDMARWRMRELLFKLGEPAPELLSTRLRRMIILHAWATWVYRFFLFLGIALLVYTFFIKIVGIILFVVEILWFILFPVGREMKHWWSIKGKIMASKRFWITATGTVCLGVLAIIPWSTTITIPALMTAEKEQAMFAPFAAQIVSMDVRDGKIVKKGDILLQLKSPQVERSFLLAQERRRLIQSRIDRSAADDQDRASLIVLTNELKEVNEELDGLKRVKAKLSIRAPFNGVIADLDPELHAGLWINPKAPLAVLQSGKNPRFKGYVSEQSVFRLSAGAGAKFIPDNRELPIVNIQVATIAEASSEQLDSPYLALPFGGKIAIEEAKKNELRPTEAVYAVAMILKENTQTPVPPKAVRGVSIISGAPESFYTRMKRQVLKVLVREMGV